MGYIWTWEMDWGYHIGYDFFFGILVRSAKRNDVPHFCWLAWKERSLYILGLDE